MIRPGTGSRKRSPCCAVPAPGRHAGPGRPGAPPGGHYGPPARSWLTAWQKRDAESVARDRKKPQQSAERRLVPIARDGSTPQADGLRRLRKLVCGVLGDLASHPGAASSSRVSRRSAPPHGEQRERRRRPRAITSGRRSVGLCGVRAARAAIPDGTLTPRHKPVNSSDLSSAVPECGARPP